VLHRPHLLQCFGGDPISSIGKSRGQSEGTRCRCGVAQLKAVGIPVIGVYVVTEANDGNNLLGRPHGYSSKEVVTDSRVPVADRGDAGGVDQGASIAVYLDSAGAKASPGLGGGSMRCRRGTLGRGSCAGGHGAARGAPRRRRRRAGLMGVVGATSRAHRAVARGQVELARGAAAAFARRRSGRIQMS